MAYKTILHLKYILNIKYYFFDNIMLTINIYILVRCFFSIVSFSLL